MNQISKTLNMKSLEEILAETEEPENNVPEVVRNITVDGARIPENTNALMTNEQMRGGDHSQAMDEIYDEALDVARKIVDLGMNIDPMRAPRILEVANQWMKTAADAKISKRESELKLMKLIQEQRKIDIEERRAGIANPNAIEGEVVFEGDRNKLLKILRSQRETNGEQPIAK